MPPNRLCLRFAAVVAANVVAWGNKGAIVHAATTSQGPRRPVTYGSIIQLEHQDTGNQLISMPEVTWRHGGQIVSGIPRAAESTELESLGWIVRSKGSSSNRLSGDDIQIFSSSTNVDKSNMSAFKIRDSGSPVKCGDTIRLEHEASGKNLHGHSEKAQLSKSHEVIGFGQGGRGDANDWFQVECVNKEHDTWHTREPVALKHVLLGGQLATQATFEFNGYNCPRCPINGHTEVFVAPHQRNQRTTRHHWIAKSIMRISLTEDDDIDDEPFAKDEL